MTFLDKLEVKNLKDKIKKLTQENELKSKEVTVLRKELRSKDEIIEDLDKQSYRKQYDSLKFENDLLKSENNGLKKKVEELQGILETLKNRTKKNNKNSGIPSSAVSIYRKEKCVNTSREKTDKKVGGQIRS